MTTSQIKAKTELYFKDHFTDAPIVYEGQNFETPSDKHWIQLQFIAYDREYLGDCNLRAIDYTMMKIRAFGSNPTKSMQLMDKVGTFLECYQDGNIYYELGKPDGNGTMDINGVYATTVDFLAKTYS